MSIQEGTLKDICSLAMKQVQDLYPNLQLMFIPHASGAFQDVVEMSEHEVLKHPAGRVARSILEKNNNRELSSFLGMAIHNEVRWMGLASIDNILALFNINLDEFESAKEARRAIYHLVWHAIDLMEIRQKPEHAAKFKNGPMIPKRSPLNLARLNLQADVFSSIMCALQGEEDAILTLGLQRASDSILPVNTRRAEDYPFVIASEAAQFAFEELTATRPHRGKYMYFARQTAIEIGMTYDDGSIKQWWGFSEPAQDMAWRHFPSEFILGCAIYSSEDPFIRANGHLISDVTGVKPLPGLQLNGSYNAFANREHNKLLHREIVEKTFEEAFAKVINESTAQPFISAANEQNLNLAEGMIVGWCANALQAAARAFDSAQGSGFAPDQAARLEFEGARDSTSWETLEDVGEKVIDEKRKGFGVTLGNLAEICSADTSMTPMLESIRATMKDPDYLKKLEAANDFALRGPAGPGGLGLSGPAPAAPSAAPKVAAPAASYAPAIPAMPGMGGPGLGGNAGAAAAAARHRAMMERMRQEQIAAKREE